MYELLLCVTDMVERWCREPQNRQSFPPVIFNITDGEATDATPEMVLRAAENLKAVATEDGNVLLVNIHLSSEPSAKALLFPQPDELSEEDVVPFDAAAADIDGNGLDINDVTNLQRFLAEFEVPYPIGEAASTMQE